MSICKYCKKTLVTENAYEDGVYRILIGWLNAITCINWYRYYPEFRRPDRQDGTSRTDEQYGMLYIPRYRPVIGSDDQVIDQIEVNVNGETQIKSCITVNETEEFDLNLYVHRETGETVRTDQTGIDYLGQSAVDVIKQVNVLIGVNEYTGQLSTAGIKLDRTDTIDTNVEKRESVWEWQALATFSGSICRQVSFPISNDELIYCVETCDGKPVCTQKICEE